MTRTELLTIIGNALDALNDEPDNPFNFDNLTIRGGMLAVDVDGDEYWVKIERRT